MERRTPRSKRTETPLPYPSLFRSHDVRNELQAATFLLRERSRLRLLVSRRGSIAIEVREYRTWPQAIMQVALVPRNAPAADARLAHKTTGRPLYRDALHRGGPQIGRESCRGRVCHNV